MPLRTRLTERLAIRHPILQAPMGSTAGGVLAAAVSAAGGLGLIGGGGAPGDWVDNQFAAAGNQRAGCGFITWRLAQQPAVLDLALAHSPTAVMFSFGDASPFISKVRQRGIPVICQIQTMAMARAAIELGADIIVAQGAEGGGHGSQRATLPLVPAVVDEAKRLGRDVLVVAAGGIADGRGLAAALMLGADGVLIGTRFHVSEESLASPAAKARIVGASGDATVRTHVFDIARGAPWPSEFTGRGLANGFAKTWHGRDAALRNDEAAREQYNRAFDAGDFDTAVVWAGEGIDLIDKIEPAAAIVEQIAAEAEAALERRFD
jgi:nitronate monooxygenase